MLDSFTLRQKDRFCDSARHLIWWMKPAEVLDFMPDIQDSIRDIRYKYPLMLWKEIAGMRILPLNG